MGENIISNNDFNKYIKNNDLQELVNDTRNTIVSFYINYETEYSLYLKYYHFIYSKHKIFTILFLYPQIQHKRKTNQYVLNLL